MIERLRFTRLDHFVRKLIPSVTIVLLMLHLMLGCCWHHEHMCSTHGRIAASSGKTPCPCDAHHQHDDRRSTAATTYQHVEQDHGQPQPCRHQCDHGPCVFLRTNGIPVLELISEHINITFATPPTPALAAVIAGHPDLARPFDCPAGLPLRAHLLYQILLI